MKLLKMITLILAMVVLSSQTAFASTDSDMSPQLQEIPDFSIRSDSIFHYQATLETPSETVRYALENAPTWMEIDAQNGLISAAPDALDIGEYPQVRLKMILGEDSFFSNEFNVAVLLANIGKDNLVHEGEVVEVEPAEGSDHAIAATGLTRLMVGEKEYAMDESSLRVEYDKEGNVLDIFGETLLPPVLSENLAIESRVSSKVGMYLGSEINLTPEFDIVLKEETRYMVFYVGTQTDVIVGSQDGGASITLEPPLSGEILFISDPTDAFFYYFAGTPLGDAGYGESDHGLIPFKPKESYAALDSFDGHSITKGKFGLGIKVFDLFEIAGERVVKSPQMDEINWDYPLESTVEYRAGFNGDADFALGIFGVGIFSFDLASTTTTLDVGVDRQHMAMQTTVAPDVSWQPDWFPILPTSSIVGRWHINGSEGFEAELQGEYTSLIPKAHFKGAMHLNAESASLTASIEDEQIPLEMRAQFFSNETHVELRTDIDPANHIALQVDKQLDEELQKTQAALDKLKNAADDYAFEVSLRGLRSALPSIVDTAVAQLNKAPGNIRNTVDNAVVKRIRSYCIKILGKKRCASSYVNEKSIGDSIGAKAKSTMTNIIAPKITALKELKKQALAADDAALRAALKTALTTVYNNRTFSKRFKYSYAVKFPWPVGKKTFTVYNKVWTIKTMSDAKASQIKLAADNAHRIAETSNIMLNASAVVESLPTMDTINGIRDDINTQLIQLPSFQGAGYVLKGNSYNAYVVLNNEKHFTQTNVLDPKSLLKMIGEVISDTLL